MDFNESLSVLVEEIKKMINDLISSAQFDRTYTGIVESITTSTNSAMNTVSVKVNGYSKTIKTYASLSAGDYVKILVPHNDWQSACIQYTDNSVATNAEVNEMLSSIL